MSKEFHSRIVLGTKRILVYEYEQPEWKRRDQDHNDESTLKVGPNHQCL